MSAITPLFLLSGPTASRKTDLAHLLAERMNVRLLSVDSMMVYKGMTIGTAKPTANEIKKFHYAGLNLAEPGIDFSTGKWLRCISAQLDDRPALAVGGTGLYFRALIDGLPPETPTKSSMEPLSVKALQTRIHALDPTALSQLADPENPRRLERALEWLEAGKPLPTSWKERAGFPIPVLRWPVDDLNERIYQRASEMFNRGLIEETRQLLEKGSLVGTAAQAIGYKEAREVLEERWSQQEALEKLTTRTRRYAKRQRTWFRNQMNARWIDIKKESNPEFIADNIAKVWQETGPYSFDRTPYV